MRGKCCVSRYEVQRQHVLGERYLSIIRLLMAGHFYHEIDKRDLGDTSYFVEIVYSKFQNFRNEFRYQSR